MVTSLLTETCCSLPISSPAALYAMFENPFWSFLELHSKIAYHWFISMHLFMSYSTFVLWFTPGTTIEESACAVFTKMWMLCYNPLYVLYQFGCGILWVVGWVLKSKIEINNQYTQRKPLYFENTGSTSSSKIGHDFRK